jgi:hypothetical protein
VAGQVVHIAAAADSFTAVCDACGAAFAGRLDPDLDAGTFLCRAGHAIAIVRAAAADAAPDAAAGAAA